ncbi:hypothetical protein Y048_4547 [Burkholderia pseudomallei MSHR456]|nr:hypothetical protein Y048_4547 [Burkholderia pseudomallei MSHR456]
MRLQTGAIVKVTKRVKRVNGVRRWRYRQLVERIARTNDTGFPDDVVLAVLKAKSGPWSGPMAAEELLASMGLKM